MKVFAISDLHLSGSCEKPMDIFGETWVDYWERIQADWAARVTDKDLVLIAGDISWAMKLDEAKIDLNGIGSLPGKKVIIRGNHDYWWQAYSKVQNELDESMFALQNNSLRYSEGVVVAGSRGWQVSDDIEGGENKKIFDREVIRLKLSLDDAKAKMQDGDKLVVMMHYPPFDAKFSDSEFTKLIAQYPVSLVVYGHLHGKEGRTKDVVDKNGIPYYLTSCDKLDHKLLELLEV